MGSVVEMVVVCVVCAMVVAVMLFTSSDGVVTDYCAVDMERCDKNGIYKYMWLGAYEDFVIRDMLDDQLVNIISEPMLALERSQQMIEPFPNSSRALLNQIEVVRYLMSIEDDPSKHSSYIESFLHLCSSILSLPEKMVCKMYVNAAQPSNNPDIIIKATAECLNKFNYLDAFTQNEYRVIQLTNLFLKKDFQGSLTSFNTISSIIKQLREWQAEELANGRKQKVPQMAPHIAVLGHAIKTIMEEDATSRHEKPDFLSDADQNLLTTEKTKYKNLMDLCKANWFSEDHLQLMQHVADIPDLFESTLKDYQHRRPLISFN